MRVNFQALQKRVDGHNGFRFDLAASFEEAQAVGGLASSAGAFLTTAIECFLVDHWEPGMELLDKAQHWIDIAIQTKEIPLRYGKFGAEATRHANRALIRWLRTGDPAYDDLDLAIDNKILFLQRLGYKDETEARLSIIYFLEAERFEDAKRYLDDYIEPVHDLKGKRGILQFASWYVERSLAGESIEPAQLEPLLRRNVAPWINDGHAAHAVRWVKRVYSTGQPEMPDAKTIIEKCRSFC